MLKRSKRCFYHIVPTLVTNYYPKTRSTSSKCTNRTIPTWTFNL